MNSQTGNPATRRVDIIVVGAGFGGMYAVYRFREMGKNVLGIEAGGDVGGVWYWNRYPGARCDLMSVDYSYGFSDEIQQEWSWSEQFAAQPEILAYANFVADKLKLRDNYLFDTRVESAVWDDKAKLWRATLDSGEIIEAPYCIMATGPLSVPKDPEIDGIGKFKGQIFRAQKWPHEEVDFTGKRVGVIGTGSSGIQIVQEVGRQAGELYVYQRTPSWSLPMRNHAISDEYQAEMKANYPGMRAAMRLNPTGGTRPVTSKGSPLRWMVGISTLPPRGRVTVAPTPAAISVSTASASRMANTATSSSPWRMISASTAVVSSVPPEAQLSAWSMSRIGPSSRVFARATESARGSA